MTAVPTAHAPSAGMCMHIPGPGRMRPGRPTSRTYAFPRPLGQPLTRILVDCLITAPF